MEILSSRSPATNGIGQQLPVPIQRPRRLRISPALRDLVRETRLTPAQLIAPIFVRHGRDLRVAIRSMPGQYQMSPDQAAREARELAERGIRAVLLFGIPARKDACGSENADPDGIVPQAIQAIKAAVPGMVVISDMCFCEYTDHGHCGVLNTPDRSDFQPQLGEGYLLNDAT
ncbi:MAG: porphobilinogen synthase, partial [Chloroflexi bacterium]